MAPGADVKVHRARKTMPKSILGLVMSPIGRVCRFFCLPRGCHHGRQAPVWKGVGPAQSSCCPQAGVPGRGCQQLEGPQGWQPARRTAVPRGPVAHGPAPHGHRSCSGPGGRSPALCPPREVCQTHRVTEGWTRDHTEAMSQSLSSPQAPNSGMGLSAGRTVPMCPLPRLRAFSLRVGGVASALPGPWVWAGARGPRGSPAPALPVCVQAPVRPLVCRSPALPLGSPPCRPCGSGGAPLPCREHGLCVAPS